MRSIKLLIEGAKRIPFHWKLVCYVFGINLLLTLFLTIPLYNELRISAGSGFVGERLNKGFDFLWWQEVQDKADGLAKTFTPTAMGMGAILTNLEYLTQPATARHLPAAILIACLVYIITRTILSGGILHLIKEGEKIFQIKSFFFGIGRFAARFLAILSISWVFYYAAGWIFSGRLRTIFMKVDETALTEKPGFFLEIVASSIILGLLFFIQMVFDYIRIRVVAEDSKSILKASRQALTFVIRNLLSALRLYYFFVILAVLATAVFLAAGGSAVRPMGLGALALSFLLQQIYVFILIWLRILLYRGEWQLYSRKTIQ